MELKIDGNIYDASKDQSGLGWQYYPGVERAQLDVLNTYSGLPIEVSTTVDINLHKSMTAEAGTVPIVVHGDLELVSGIPVDESETPENLVMLAGGENAPAIQVDGQFSLLMYRFDNDNFKLILKSGGTGVPAIKAASVKRLEKMFYAGTDATNIFVAYRYSNEEYMEFVNTYFLITGVTGRCALPELPEFEDEIPVGWRNVSIDLSKDKSRQLWYMPGDEIDAGRGVRIEAEYVSNDGRTAVIIIDGHGGTMISGSRYFVDYSSASNQYPYYYPSNPFTNPGKTFIGYNTAVDGSGTMYQPGERFVATEPIQRYYAQWKSENSGSSGGGGGGGGASAPISAENTVSASNASNGKVALNKNTAKKGDTVTVTVTPDAGYQLDKLTVTDAKGKTVDVTKKSDGKYTFTMPDSKVTITPTFSKIEDTKSSKNGFNDVASSAWYADAVQYVTNKGLMNGTGSDTFSPNASTTRGMLMTVLARYAGTDTTDSTPWYQKGMEWAKANGVSDGTNPEVNITREQLVTMLYRYAGSPKANGSLDSFSDAASVSSYAVNAMQWAVANGIVNGSNGKLNPKNNATRAEVAAILMRFCEMSK